MCRDTDFCVAIVALQCETRVYRDRVPSVATGLAAWRFGFVSRQRHFSGRLKSVET